MFITTILFCLLLPLAFTLFALTVYGANKNCIEGEVLEEGLNTVESLGPQEKEEGQHFLLDSERVGVTPEGGGPEETALRTGDLVLVGGPQTLPAGKTRNDLPRLGVTLLVHSGPDWSLLFTPEIRWVHRQQKKRHPAALPSLDPVLEERRLAVLRVLGDLDTLCASARLVLDQAKKKPPSS